MIPCWSRLEKFLNYLLIFLLPTQLALHFWPPFAFIFGIRVDYLAPSIYLTDALFLTLFIIWVGDNQKKFLKLVGKYKKYVFFFLFIAILNIAFSTSIGPSIYKWLKLMELGLLCFYVRVRADIFKSKTLFNTLFYSLVFFSMVGIFQFTLGRTLGGPLYLLGERNFNVSTPGIALTQILGRNFMRAYSTFSHPNSFAGYLGLGLLVLLFGYSKKDLIKRSWGILMICIAFVLTFSLSAIVGFFACGVLFLLVHRKLFRTKNVIYIPGALLLVSLAFVLLSKVIIQNGFVLPQNIKQRVVLSLAAGSMISQKFLLGEGLNTFVINEPRIEYMGSYLWNLQPVHNIFLLIFSETGAIGLSLFYFLLIILTRRALVFKDTAFYVFLVFILTSGLFDHYWFTLQQNMFLAAFVLANPFRVES